MNLSNKQSIITINSFSLLSSAIVLTVGAFFLTLTQNMRFVIPMLIEGFSFLTVIAVNSLQKYTAANLWLFIIHSFFVVYWSVTFGEAMPLEVIFAFLFVLLVCGSFFIYRQRQMRIACLAISGALMVFIQINFHYQLVPPLRLDPHAREIMRWCTTGAMLVFIFLIMSGYIRKIDGLISALNASNNILMTKSAFLRETYHELRTPLNGIYGIAQLMQLRKKQYRSEDERRQIDDLNVAAYAARSIINNVLDLSKLEAGKLDTINTEVIHLQEFLEHCTSINRYVASSRNLKIKLILDHHLPEYILCDKLMLTKIINNLLSNAMKFGAEDSIVELKSFVKYQQLNIQVRNQGLINREKAAKIFEPFTAERNTSFEGTGLGLSITKVLVELLDGNINVDADPYTNSTTFSFYIPLLEPRPEDIPQEEPMLLPGNYLEGKKILVIDDDSITRFMLKSLLTTMGATPILSESGEKGLEIIKSERPAAIISDLHTGKVSGKEVCIQVRGLEELKHIPIIIISGDAFKETNDELLRVGANEFITKPISFRELNIALSKCLCEAHHAENWV